MNNIKEFLEAFFIAETESYYKRRFPDIIVFNKQLEIMNNFCIEELQNSFGLVTLTTQKDKDYYEKWKDAKKPNPRHIYKISEYENEKYGKIFVAYCSKYNPRPNKFRYFECLFLSKIEGELKIVKSHLLDDDDDVPGQKKWFSGHGYKDMKFDSLGKFIRSERYLEPKDCEFSLVDYKKDK